MATAWYFTCDKCNGSFDRPIMFEALKQVAENKQPDCKQCKLKVKLVLEFEFALSSKEKFIVEGSFFPQNENLDTWTDPDTGHSITFYPFLVIGRNNSGKMNAWLPYWHEVLSDKKRSVKYGQWAPYMDIDIYKDLLAQARAKGFLISE